jgi:hypothetical protein
MKKIILYMSILSLLAAACTEKVDIRLDSTYTRLVVYGTMTTDPSTQYVSLTKSSSYYYNEVPPPVSNAALSITDNLGNKVDLSETQPGIYATPTDYHVIPGNSYTLDIQLAEPIEGSKNYSASCLVKPIYSIDSIRLAWHPDWGKEGVYEVKCYYKDPPTKDFYMFNIYKNRDLLTDTITKRFVIDDQLFNGNYTNGIGVGYLNQENPRERLNPGDTVTFQGCNITEDFYNFVRDVQTATGFQAPIFSGPPANVKGNLDNGAIGFFATYSVGYASVIFNPAP